MGNTVRKLLDHPEEERSIERTFKEYDRNKNGRLEKSEWVRFAQELRGTLLKKESKKAAGESEEEFVERVFHLADTDGDGIVSYDEFRAFILSQSHEGGEAEAVAGKEKEKEEEEQSVPPPALPPVEVFPGPSVVPSSIHKTLPLSHNTSPLSPLSDLPTTGEGSALKPKRACSDSSLPPALSAHVSGVLGESSVSVSKLPFIKEGFILFRGVHTEPPSFAHDRGNIDNNSYLIGVWSLSESRVLKSEEYPKIFSRFDLSMAEAIQFWRAIVVKGSYEEKPSIDRYARCQGPSFKENILRLSTYEYTGMRGNVYTHWRVEFPKSEGGKFTMEDGGLDAEIEQELDRLQREASERARIEEERKKEEEKKNAASAKWKPVPVGVTAYANVNRTFVAFIQWDGRSGWTNSSPNGSIPNCNLSSGVVSPKIISAGGNYTEEWVNQPLQYCLDKLGAFVRLTPLNDWRLRNITVSAVYDQNKKEYRMSLKYRDAEMATGSLFTASEPESEELTEIFTDSLETAVKMWADKETGIIAVSANKDPGGKMKNGYYKAMFGRPHFFFRAEKEDLNNSFNLSPCDMVTWKE